MEDDKREDLKLKKTHYKMVRDEEAILEFTNTCSISFISKYVYHFLIFGHKTFFVLPMAVNSLCFL